jgi:hypothetical protein
MEPVLQLTGEYTRHLASETIQKLAWLIPVLEAWTIVA